MSGGDKSTPCATSAVAAEVDGAGLAAGDEDEFIALARAQLADPAVLLLDEATAALDLAAEAAVMTGETLGPLHGVPLGLLGK